MSTSIPKITIIGSLNIDIVTRTSVFPKAGETVYGLSCERDHGGKGANQAIATRRLSPWEVHVKMVGAVGKDAEGKELKESLAQNGIDVSSVQEITGTQTGSATIIVEEETGQNRILIVSGANNTLTKDPSWLESDTTFAGYGDLAIFQLETPFEAVVAHVSAAHAAGTLTLLNPSPAPESLAENLYSKVDILILNESELSRLSGRQLPFIDAPTLSSHTITVIDEIASSFVAKGVRVVITTLGASGVYIKIDKDGKWLPAAKVTKVVDTTGAGDTFLGAIAACFAKAKAEGPKAESESLGTISGLKTIIEYGLEASAKTVAKAGAQSSIPTAKEVGDDSLKNFMRLFSPET
jgi:ribokinase